MVSRDRPLAAIAIEQAVNESSYMAERIGAQITSVPASHAVFMTQPKVVAGTIDRAAKEAAPQIRQQ